MRRPILTAAIAVSLCLLSLAASAQDHKANVDPKLDNYGDPLPPGAVLRLGTIHLQCDRSSRFAWTPDGKSLVTSSPGKVWIWNVEDGRLLKSISAPIQYMGGLTPDGSKLIGTAAGRRPIFLDLKTEEHVSPPEELHPDDLRTLVLAPDGTSFATASRHDVVRVWDVATGRPLLNLSVEKKSWPEIGLAYSPDSRSLAVGAAGTIRIFDLEDATGSALIEKAHGGETTWLAFTPDGKQLISGGTSAYELLKADDGRRLATFHCEVSIWDVAERRRLGTLEFPEPMNGPGVMALTPDGNLLVTMHRTKSYVWDLNERKIVRTFEGFDTKLHPIAMKAAVDPTGKYVAAHVYEPHLRMYDLESGEHKFPRHQRHSSDVVAVAWSRDGRWIATGSTDGAVYVWDATSGQQTRVLKHGANWVRRLAFTADSTALLVGAEAIDEKEGKFGGAFSMWNIDTGAIVYQVPLPERVTTIALSHDGRQVAVATGKPTSDPGEPRPPRIHVFSVAAGEKLTEINARPGLIQSIGWSPDDSVVVAACDDNTIRRLEVASGRELSTHATRHEREDMGRIVETALASAALLGDDSTVLTTGSSANDAHAWDLTTGESIWMLHGKWSYIHQMAIAPNARIVALHQRDSRRSRSYLTLWDVAMRRELMQIDVGKEFVQAMAFSPDGKRIVTGLDSGNALVWDVAAASETLGGESSDTSNRKKSIP